MAKHTLKILRCEHRKILKYVWPFFNIMSVRILANPLLPELTRVLIAFNLNGLDAEEQILFTRHYYKAIS